MPALVSALLSLQGCKGQDQPKAKLIEKASPFDRGARSTRERAPDDPLRNPAREAPAERSGDQPSDEEIDALLAEAAEASAASNVVAARSALRKCANKVPANARCDGEYGLTMASAHNRRAAAIYYLEEAAGNDDADADADFYMRVGEALRAHGQFEGAISALEKAVTRDGSADNIYALGRALSLRPETISEGAETIAKARAIDDRLAWVYEEAVLRGQIPTREDAELGALLMRTYIERAAEQPKDEVLANIETLAARASELEATSKSYPLRKDYEAARAEALEAASAGDGPPSGSEGDPGTPPAAPQ